MSWRLILRTSLAIARAGLAVTTLTLFLYIAFVEASLIKGVVQNDPQVHYAAGLFTFLLKAPVSVIWFIWLLGRTLRTHVPSNSRNTHLFFGIVTTLSLTASVAIPYMNIAPYPIAFALGVAGTISIVSHVTIIEIKLLTSPTPTASAPSRGYHSG